MGIYFQTILAVHACTYLPHIHGTTKDLAWHGNFPLISLFLSPSQWPCLLTFHGVLTLSEVMEFQLTKHDLMSPVPFLWEVVFGGFGYRPPFAQR